MAGLLAVVFLTGSATRLFAPMEKLAVLPVGGWVEDVSAGTVKAIGAVEVLTAMGLILPAVLEIAPVLVPLAATGGVLLMVGAIITRLRRREAAIAAALAHLALAAFVARGRFGRESFTS
ncbi:DoxX family protein [Streptomyces sp. NPDC048483]|uniref:DoxX family protein n=1 Tax=Streptomyces sp. NPDC048483 TaxID=3154927 RepID=UPI00344423EE